MPKPNARTIGRDVFFYDSRTASSALGGLILTRGTTNTSFYSMIDILITTSSPYILHNDNGEILPRNSQPLLLGNYFITTDDLSPVQVNNEFVFTRARSIQTGTRTQEFVDEVRDRDKGCVVSKIENSKMRIDQGNWGLFEAAHIFPLAYEQHWEQFNYGRWITTIPPAKGGTINSVQNGLLLKSDIHHEFDTYQFSINPDVSTFRYF